MPRPVASERPIVSGDRNTPHNFDFTEFFGWHTIAGTVITAEPLYMAKPESSGFWLIPKLIIGIMLLPFAAAVVVAGFIVSGMWSMFFRFGSRDDGPGFVSRVASQLLGYYLTGKLFGPKDLVPVRDVRLRDGDAQEHLVRIRGELSAGNVAVGDEIEVSGFIRHGTLMFERGINRRTHAAILVRRR
jgi:hypothetical protein